MKKRLLSLFSLALAAAVLLNACNQSPALKKLDRLNQKNPAATADTRQGRMQHSIHTDTGGQDENSPVQKYDINNGKNSATQNVKSVAVSGGKNAGTATDGAGSGGTGNGESGDEALPIEVSTTGVPMTEMIDATTAPVPLPKDVKTVAATGGVAEMVEMLKNSGQKLVATSQEAKSGLFYSLFSPKDAGLKDAALLDDNEYNELLSAKARPQVVFYTEGAYDETQLKTLRAVGIYPVALYDYSVPSEYQDSDFCQTVLNQLFLNAQIVAKVLNGDSSAYINYCKSVEKEIESNCKGDGTWYTNYNTHGLTFNLDNEIGYVSDYHKIQTNEDGEPWYYVCSKLPMENIHLIGSYSTFLNYRCNDCAFNCLTSYNPFYFIFPSLSLKTKVEQYIGQIRQSVKNNTDGSPFYGTKEHPYSASFSDQTKYFVNPKGACSWIEQSPESILEAYFLGSVARNYSGGTGNPEGFVKSKISSFYKDYLHVNLTDAQVSEIYDGPQD